MACETTHVQSRAFRLRTAQLLPVRVGALVSNNALSYGLSTIEEFKKEEELLLIHHFYPPAEFADRVAHSFVPTLQKMGRMPPDVVEFTSILWDTKASSRSRHSC